jgi:hypothetical protein
MAHGLMFVLSPRLSVRFGAIVMDSLGSFARTRARFAAEIARHTYYSVNIRYIWISGISYKISGN